jgi:hypothetical protein
MSKPDAAIVIAEDGVTGRGVGGAAEESLKAVAIEAGGVGDVVAGEADEVGALGEAGFEADGEVGGGHAVGDVDVGDVEETFGAGDGEGK